MRREKTKCRTGNLIYRNVNHALSTSAGIYATVQVNVTIAHAMANKQRSLRGEWSEYLWLGRPKKREYRYVTTSCEVQWRRIAADNQGGLFKERVQLG